MNSTNYPATKNKLMEFSLQLMHRKIEFTALGLFPLNRELVFMVCGIAVISTFNRIVSTQSF